MWGAKCLTFWETQNHDTRARVRGWGWERRHAPQMTLRAVKLLCMTPERTSSVATKAPAPPVGVSITGRLHGAYVG